MFQHKRNHQERNLTGFRRESLQILVMLIGSFYPVISHADAVNEWNATATTVIVTNEKRPAPAAVVDAAYVHAAIYNAGNSIDGPFTPYAFRLRNVPRLASREAATAAAAYTVLKTFFPAEQAFLDSAYASSLKPIPNGDTKNEGISVGKTVAYVFLQMRTNDGRNANVSYTFGSGPGVCQLTPGAPPPPATPVAPWLAKMKPFTLKSTSQFRPDGPPDLDSDDWSLCRCFKVFLRGKESTYHLDQYCDQHRTHVRQHRRHTHRDRQRQGLWRNVLSRFR